MSDEKKPQGFFHRFTGVATHFLADLTNRIVSQPQGTDHGHTIAEALNRVGDFAERFAETEKRVVDMYESYTNALTSQVDPLDPPSAPNLDDAGPEKTPTKKK